MDFGASSVFNRRMKDYYRILEIHPNASREVLNNAYRTLVRKYHPDLFHSTDKARMTEKMRTINEAYETLSNEATRTDYDRRYRTWQATGGANAALPPDRKTLLRNMILWALGTYLLLRFLKPLLMSPLGKAVLLGLLVYLLVRFFSRRKTPS